MEGNYKQQPQSPPQPAPPVIHPSAYSQVQPVKICPYCGNVNVAQSIQCPRCFQNLSNVAPQYPQPIQPVQPQPQQAPVAVQQRSNLVCPKCHSQNISVQAVAEEEKRGCLSVLIYIILACTIIGLILLIPLLRGQKTTTHTYAICQSCGNRWMLK